METKREDEDEPVLLFSGEKQDEAERDDDGNESVWLTGFLTQPGWTALNRSNQLICIKIQICHVNAMQADT